MSAKMVTNGIRTHGRYNQRILWIRVGDGAVIWPLSRDGGAEELRGDPTVGPRPKVWTKDQRWKMLCQKWPAGEAQMQDNS